MTDKKIQIQISILFMMIFILFGAMLNLLVIATNDGRMPVRSETFENTDTHFRYSDPSDIRLAHLADNTKIGSRIYSKGDFLIIIPYGVILYLSVLLFLEVRKSRMKAKELSKIMFRV